MASILALNGCPGSVDHYIATKVGEDAPPPLPVLIREAHTRGPERAFSEILEISASALPSSIEILLAPGLSVAVVVHLPVQATNGHVVPLGFVSIDADVVARAEQLLQEVTSIELPVERVTEDMIDFPE